MSVKKVYHPSAAFSEAAHIKSEVAAERFRETALLQRDAFWSELSKALVFEKPFEEVLRWKAPKAEWFAGGEINVSRNCLDRHLASRGDKPAIIWEAEPLTDAKPEVRYLSYKELHALTCQIANTLKDLGVSKGDRVAIYMPMVPETVATMQACARIGAPFTVIFGGFSAQSIADRLKDSGAKAIVTADGTWRKGKFLELKKIVDQALELAPSSVEKVLVYERAAKIKANARDVSWADSVLKAKKESPVASLSTEDPLFILYTSGTTGKPKGLYHTQAGYLLGAHWTSRWLFDLKEDDIYWCTADCGWITGHTYIAFGPLSNGATVFMYEGAPTWPDAGRIWQIIERHTINILYTAPTAIRTFMRMGDDWPAKCDLSSLRLLGTVGEPINPEAWEWYYKQIGDGLCPIVDTWWQTETGATMIAPFPGATPQKPGCATKPMPGIQAAIVNADTGKECAAGEKGALVIRQPWPYMARGIWGDPERYDKTYWNAKPFLRDTYLTGDMATMDEDGDIWIEGRMDDVMNISGHRIGSAEVESALVSHPDIAEAAAVGIPDEIKGQSLVVFITPKDAAAAAIAKDPQALHQLKEKARDFVGREIGAHAKPDHVRIAKTLPKTRSGKIMRRLLRELASTGKISGDTSTLEDFSADAAIEKED